MFEGSYCMAKVELAPNEEIQAQSDAMVAM
ncbi:MAG: hypothetical protein BWY02_02311 [bacterium ADurb.Bin157]|nr:MAG: hypothetical protein BWY02_02311 [bacterium ADurb.Bin157]